MTARTPVPASVRRAPERTRIGLRRRVGPDRVVSRDRAPVPRHVGRPRRRPPHLTRARQRRARGAQRVPRPLPADPGAEVRGARRRASWRSRSVPPAHDVSLLGLGPAPRPGGAPLVPAAGHSRGGPELGRLYWSEDDRDLDFNGAVADDEVVAEAWASWRREVAHGQEVLRATTDLGAHVDVHGEPAEIRDIVVHLVEEYARHVGHADLLRECIDGRTAVARPAVSEDGSAPARGRPGAGRHRPPRCRAAACVPGQRGGARGA